MAIRKMHYRYQAVLAVVIQFWESGKVLTEIEYKPIGQGQGEFLYKGHKIILENFLRNDRSVWLLFLKDIHNLQWFLSEYIPDLQANRIDFPSGGVIFLDTESRELIKTNFDIGESEEWKAILMKIKSNKEVLHTFSATDKAIELKDLDGDIYMQTLFWEAVPDRLNTSREAQPIHIFKKSEEFFNQIENIFSVLNSIFAEIQGKANRDLLLTYFSVSYRLNKHLPI